MTPQELQQRTLAFAIAIYRFVRPLLSQADTRHIAQQLLRAADADGLTDEARQISRIFGASYRTSRTNQKKVGGPSKASARPPQIDR